MNPVGASLQHALRPQPPPAGTAALVTGCRRRRGRGRERMAGRTVDTIWRFAARAVGGPRQRGVAMTTAVAERRVHMNTSAVGMRRRAATHAPPLARFSAGGVSRRWLSIAGAGGGERDSDGCFPPTSMGVLPQAKPSASTTPRRVRSFAAHHPWHSSCVSSCATPAGDPTQRTRGGVTVKIAGFPIVFVPQKKGGGGKTHHTETHTEEHTETKD